MTIARGLAALLGVSLAGGVALADNWTVNMTVDNQFAAYFGNSMSTSLVVGSGNSWPTTYTFNVTGAAATDYLYVATASDYTAAQGFLGEFRNTTQNYTFLTGVSNNWQVFPAGRYLQQLFGMSGAWPNNQMPTQGEIDTAIAYATTNNLWLNPVGFTNWDNRVTGNQTIWGHRAGIDPNAAWIWHRAPGGPANPLQGGFNHEEFLVFRVVGVPTPGSLGALALAGVVALRRRR